MLCASTSHLCVRSPASNYQLHRSALATHSQAHIFWAVLQDRARSELEQRLLLMHKRRKVQEPGEASGESGQRLQRIPAHRPTTQQQQQLQQVHLSQQAAAAGAEGRGHVLHQQHWAASFQLPNAHHRMTPILGESLSATDLSTSSTLALGPAASSTATITGVNGGGNGGAGLQQSWQRMQQQSHLVAGSMDLDTSGARRTSMVGMRGSILGLTPRTSLAPCLEQPATAGGGGAGGSTASEQQAQHNEGLPLLRQKKPSLQHATTINVRAGPQPGQLMPPSLGAATAAAAAAAVASKRRSVVEPEERPRQGPLGPEDSLSYGPRQFGSPRSRQAAASVQRERAGVAARGRGTRRQLHASPSLTQLPTAVGHSAAQVEHTERRQQGQQPQPAQQQQLADGGSDAGLAGGRMQHMAHKDRSNGAAAGGSLAPPALAAESSSSRRAGARAAAAGAKHLGEQGPGPPGSSSSSSPARWREQQRGRHPGTPPRSPVVPMGIERSSPTVHVQGQGVHRGAPTAASRSPPRSPAGLGLSASPSLRHLQAGTEASHRRRRDTLQQQAVQQQVPPRESPSWSPARHAAQRPMNESPASAVAPSAGPEVPRPVARLRQQAQQQALLSPRRVSHPAAAAAAPMRALPAGAGVGRGGKSPQPRLK